MESDSFEPSSERGPRALERVRLAALHSFRSACARVSLRGASLVPLRATHQLAGWLARPLIQIPGRARDSMLTNLALCFPELDEAARAELARESLAEALRAMLELGPLWCWGRERVLSLVQEVVGEDRLEAALAARRGVVFLGPHLGSWELAGLYVSARLSITSLYRPPRVRKLEGLYRHARERFGARLVPADAGGVRELYRALQRGEAIGVLPDQAPGRHGGIFAPFFGLMAKTSTLAARLITSTGAVPLFGWAERLERGSGFRLHFFEPELGPSGGQDDVERVTCALNSELERLIRRRPQQYLWSYQRFKQRPEGEPNPYRRDRARAAGSAQPTHATSSEAP